MTIILENPQNSRIILQNPWEEGAKTTIMLKNADYAANDGTISRSILGNPRNAGKGAAMLPIILEILRLSSKSSDYARNPWIILEKRQNAAIMLKNPQNAGKGAGL